MQTPGGRCARACARCALSTAARFIAAWAHELVPTVTSSWQRPAHELQIRL
jgi:hypothetical protein